MIRRARIAARNITVDVLIISAKNDNIKVELVVLTTAVGQKNARKKTVIEKADDQLSFSRQQFEVVVRSAIHATPRSAHTTGGNGFLETAPNLISNLDPNG